MTFFSKVQTKPHSLYLSLNFSILISLSLKLRYPPISKPPWPKLELLHHNHHSTTPQTMAFSSSQGCPFRHLQAWTHVFYSNRSYLIPCPLICPLIGKYFIQRLYESIILVRPIPKSSKISDPLILQ